MSIEIRVNGQPFTLWESAEVQRSIDSNSGVFRFTNSSTTPTSIQEYPVKVDDFVEVLISGVRKIAGFVDEMPDSFGEVKGKEGTFHTVNVSGRDNVQDLIDSSIPDDAKVTEGPVTLKQLCEKVISALGAQIKVINNVSDIAEFTSEDLQAAGSGETCMSYLVSFARKRQVYLVPDGSGNLLIFRPDITNKASSPLIHKKNNSTNNILTYSANRSRQGRFNKYVCRSQDNFGYDPFASIEEGTDRNDQAVDSKIRDTRYFEFQAEESMNDSECKDRASEEANIRRALGTAYTGTVAGTTQSDGTVWDFGQFVDLEDDLADMHGEFLVKAVSYMQDINKGTRTTLVLAEPDAYQVTAEPTKENERTSNTGNTFQNAEPQTQDTTIR